MAPDTDDELPIEGAGHRRESRATLGTQAGPSRTVRIEAKDQGVGRKPVAPLKHQLSPWSHRLHPNPGTVEPSTSGRGPDEVPSAQPTS